MSCLELKDFKFLRGDLSILDIPSLTLSSGSDTILTGASGSGKSTLIHLLAGFMSPTAGQYLLDGKDVGDLSESKWDRLRGERVGLVLQNSPLLRGFDLLDNILIPMGLRGRTDRRRAESLLEHVGLADRIHHLPTQLSSGQRQRATIVRALINQPDIVLADEPTAHLDPESGEQSLALLREMTSELGATLLMASHNPSHIPHFSNHLTLTKDGVLG